MRGGDSPTATEQPWADARGEDCIAQRCLPGAHPRLLPHLGLSKHMSVCGCGMWTQTRGNGLSIPRGANAASAVACPAPQCLYMQHVLATHAACHMGHDAHVHDQPIHQRRRHAQQRCGREQQGRNARLGTPYCRAFWSSCSSQNPSAAHIQAPHIIQGLSASFLHSPHQLQTHETQNGRNRASADVQAGAPGRCAGSIWDSRRCGRRRQRPERERGTLRR
jgi:hypothetical protein